MADPFTYVSKEYFQEFKCGDKKSKFAQHVLENQESIVPTDYIIEVLHVIKKCGFQVRHPRCVFSN